MHSNNRSVRGHKCLKTFKLSCIICNFLNYACGAMFVVYVLRAFICPPRSKFQLAEICPAISQTTKRFEASGLGFCSYVWIGHRIYLIPATGTFLHAWATCSTCFNEPKMSPFILRKDSVNGGWNLPKGKNCTRKICIWRVDLAFSLFRKALLKNCLKQWTASAWQLLDIYSM